MLTEPGGNDFTKNLGAVAASGGAGTTRMACGCFGVWSTGSSTGSVRDGRTREGVARRGLDGEQRTSASSLASMSVCRLFLLLARMPSPSTRQTSAGADNELRFERRREIALVFSRWRDGGEDE